MRDNSSIFKSSDIGLGTVYERCKLYEKIKWFIKNYQIKNVLEGPMDGITGIKGLNSLMFAKNKIPVVVVIPEKNQIDYAKEIAERENCSEFISYIKGDSLMLAAGTYDLVWNFHAISLSKNPQGILLQMTQKSRKYVIIFEINRQNYGFLLHRFYHWLNGCSWKHGDSYWMKKEMLKKNIEKNGFKTKLEFFFDSPFWPDIDDMAKVSKLIGRDSYIFFKKNFPYFMDHENLQRTVKKMSFIENSTDFDFIKPFFSHFFGILAEKI